MERIPLGDDSPLEAIIDDNGRMFLFCQQCSDHKFVSDDLEMTNRTKNQRLWWAITHLRFLVRSTWQHFKCLVEYDKRKRNDRD